MTIDEFIAQIEDSLPPAPGPALARLEEELGCSLPDDYRSFLLNCNGGYVGGRLWFNENVGVHHIAGFRRETHFSLSWARQCYQSPNDLRIPTSLLKIMDDPFGNAICLGISGAHRGKVYFWDHEREPDPETWDGSVSTAGNVEAIADSFTGFVAGLHEQGDA